MDKQDATTFSNFKNMIRENVLRIFFPLTVVWALLLLFAEEIDRLQRLNPIPESGSGHHFFEVTAFWLLFLFVFVMATWLIHHKYDFLRLPRSVPLIKTSARIAVHGLLLFVFFTVGTVAVFYLFYDPETDPQGQFHIWVWLGGLLYASALAPLSAVLTVWASRGGPKEAG